MLLRFRCENFRSIREEQELSLVAVNTRSDEKNDSLLETPIKNVKALRTAAIYGANASGKSNVLRALRIFAAIISDSQRQWNPTGPIPAWDPFILDKKSSAGATTFQIDFLMGSIVYNYGFRFNDSTFLEEWLIDITGRAKVLFRRRTKNDTTSVVFPGKNLATTREDSQHLDLIRLQTRANSLFLSSAAQSNHKILSRIFRWINARFYILTPKEPSSLRSYTAELCSSKDDRKRQIKALMAFADIGIVDFEIAEEEAPEQIKKTVAVILRALKEAGSESMAKMFDDLPSSRHSIRMLHRGANEEVYPLDFDEESSGTQAYFHLLGPILEELNDGSILLIDELDSSLHPNLSKQIVRIFNDPTLNPKGAQLIFTAHDITLLDLGMLRRDQIWFTEKSNDGATALIQLSQFKPRKEQNVASAYLHGRFGGVPFFDEELLESITK